MGSGQNSYITLYIGKSLTTKLTTRAYDQLATYSLLAHGALISERRDLAPFRVPSRRIYTTPYHTIPYHTILYYTIIYYAITVLYCTVLYCAVLYCAPSEG